MRRCQHSRGHRCFLSKRDDCDVKIKVKLLRLLEARGVSTFDSCTCIRPGDNWLEVIENELGSVTLVIVFISSECMERFKLANNQVDTLLYEWSLIAHARNISVLPILISNAEQFKFKPQEFPDLLPKVPDGRESGTTTITIRGIVQKMSQVQGIHYRRGAELEPIASEIYKKLFEREEKIKAKKYFATDIRYLENFKQLFPRYEGDQLVLTLSTKSEREILSFLNTWKANETIGLGKSEANRVVEDAIKLFYGKKCDLDTTNASFSFTPNVDYFPQGINRKEFRKELFHIYRETYETVEQLQNLYRTPVSKSVSLTAGISNALDYLDWAEHTCAFLGRCFGQDWHFPSAREVSDLLRIPDAKKSDSWQWKAFMKVIQFFAAIGRGTIRFIWRPIEAVGRLGRTIKGIGSMIYGLGKTFYEFCKCVYRCVVKGEPMVGDFSFMDRITSQLWKAFQEEPIEFLTEVTLNIALIVLTSLLSAGTFAPLLRTSHPIVGSEQVMNALVTAGGPSRDVANVSQMSQLITAAHYVPIAATVPLTNILPSRNDIEMVSLSQEKAEEVEVEEEKEKEVGSLLLMKDEEKEMLLPKDNKRLLSDEFEKGILLTRLSFSGYEHASIYDNVLKDALITRLIEVSI